MFSYTDTIKSTTTVAIVHDHQQPERFAPVVQVGVTSIIGLENTAWLDTDIARQMAAEIIARCDELDEGRCTATDEGQRCQYRADSSHPARHRDQDMRSWEVATLADSTAAVCAIIAEPAK